MLHLRQPKKHLKNPKTNSTVSRSQSFHLFTFTCQELKKCLVICEKAAKEFDFRSLTVLTKEFKRLRRLFSLPDVVLVLQFYLKDLAAKLNLLCPPAEVEPGMSLEDKMHCKADRASEIMKLPEAQLFVYVLLLIKLYDDGDFNTVSPLFTKCLILCFSQAKDFGDFICARLKGGNKKTLEQLGAKAVYFTSVVYEKLGCLTELRPLMFDLYKEFCLEVNQIG